MELVGWIGSICFAVCAIPQAYTSWKTKRSDGISNAFIWLWFIGEVATLIYILPKGHIPLIFNYIGNLISLLVIMWYKYRPQADQLQNGHKDIHVDKNYQARP